MAKIDDLALAAIAAERRVENLEDEYRQLKVMYERPPEKWPMTEDQFRKVFRQIETDTIRAYKEFSASQGPVEREALRMCGNDPDKAIELARARIAFLKNAGMQAAAAYHRAEDEKSEKRQPPVGSLAASLEQKNAQEQKERAAERERILEANRGAERDRAEAQRRARETVKALTKEPEIGGFSPS